MKVIGKQSSGLGIVTSGSVAIAVNAVNELVITNEVAFFSHSLEVSGNLYVSGNTSMGVHTSSTHEITGSLLLTGSSTQIGVATITGSVIVTRDSTFIQDVYVSGTLKGPFSQSVEARVNALEEQRFFLGGDISAEGTLTGTATTKYTASLDISLNPISASQLIFPSESRKVYVAEYGSDNLLTPHRGKSPATPFKTIKAAVQSIYGNYQVSASQVSGSGQSGSATEASIISQSYATVAEILVGGLGVTPAVVKNGSTALITIGSVSQSTYDNYGSASQGTSISSSFATILNILGNGLGATPVLVPNGLIPKNLSANSQIAGTAGTNAVSQSISSSFSTLLSIVNGGAPAAPVVVNNSQTITSDANKLNARTLVLRNKGFIQDETIEYIKYVFPFFTYNPLRCKRDVGLLIDAVLDDLVFGGNEKTVQAGLSYYNGNFGEIQFGAGGVANSQKEETIAAISYAARMIRIIAAGGTISAPLPEVLNAKTALLGNLEFLQEEVINFI